MSRPRVAVLGADSLVGETLLELLIERRFPAAEIRAFALNPAAGSQVSAGGESWDLEELAGAPFADFDLLLAAPRCGLDASQLRPLAGSAQLIDLGGHFVADEQVPLVVPEANGSSLTSDVPLIACPSAMAILLATALAPLQAEWGLRRVQVASYEAVSDLGREAVEELVQQTRQLLTFQTVSSRVFPRQIAFNCLPHTGATEDEDSARVEQAVSAELRRLLAAKTLPISINAVRVPVFYGHGATVSVETERPFDLADVQARLAGSAGLKLLPATEAPYYPTPVTEASGEDAVLIGRLRRDPSHPQGLQFWLVADNLRKGSALNAVQIAEQLQAG